MKHHRKQMELRDMYCIRANTNGGGVAGIALGLSQKNRNEKKFPVPPPKRGK